jgi:5-methylcytosine-specific restriction enzyme A
MVSRHISDHYRRNATERGYGRRWKTAAALFLRRHAWCDGCAVIGVRRQAELVDHIVPHRGDQRLFWNTNNWQASCAWHHNSIKAELERLYAAGKITSSELHLHSATAIRLTRERHRPAIGADGFAIPGS